MYSLDGEQGTYQEYTAPISVSENTSIWAYGYKEDYNNSSTVNAVYNILTIAQEPENHPTNFTATANSHNSITLSWTESDADAYLIKGSDVSFEDIESPVDGVSETDGTLVKNVGSAKSDHEFTGLEPETEYFFKIFPYNGTGAGEITN